MLPPAYETFTLVRLDEQSIENGNLRPVLVICQEMHAV
ncbi:hypothetical protein C7453_101588 [Gluconacetobacter liquefaciens]|uniref:Uncharacterized protein n=1 Tax=Gluconacetobacter liquefaciens TaxID=89584 RepID=A0A370GCJ0_GLULI|nr:hypothetical protein C7453_101588 [Gluconacetobacter liquefaciens]